MIGRAALLLSACVLALAQPAFEVASIKAFENPPGARVDFSSSGPRVVYKAYGLFHLVMESYDLKDYQVSFAAPPTDMDSIYYDIVAKAEGDAPRSRAQFRQMLKALLAERFRLKAHRENREMPVYLLIVGKGGPKFKESAPDAVQHFLGGVNGRNQNITVTKGTMALLAWGLTDFLGVDRPVIDKTGLTDVYDFKVEATPGWRRDTELGDLSVFTAVQQQLGLKLEPAKATVEVLVVDHVEKPSAN